MSVVTMVPSTVQRNRPGTKNKNLFGWGNIPLESMDTTFAAQQYIQQLIREDPTDVEAILKVPEGTDEAVWQYEHLRQFTLEFNQLVVLFDPVCNEVYYFVLYNILNLSQLIVY